MSELRVLLLSRYGRLGASSRVRSLQYLPGLAQAGIAVSVAPLFSDDYVERLYDGRGQSWTAVAACYAARVAKLLAARRFDVAWVEKELLPYLPGWVELALGRLATRLVVDYDDAVFHRYDQHRWSFVRRLLGHKIDALMRAADLVLVGNEYLGERARSAGAGRVELLPTVVDTERYSVPLCTGSGAGTNSGAGAGAGVRIGWIGTPSTAAYLEPLAGAFDEVHAATGAQLVLIGAGAAVLADRPWVQRSAWSEESEVAQIQRCDLGIMPLPDLPFERGKCGYKLVQFMACGRPVVASPVGVNSALVSQAASGFLATRPEEWRDGLIGLVQSAELRLRMGLAGRSCVEERYSLQSAGQRLAELLRDAAAPGSVGRVAMRG